MRHHKRHRGPLNPAGRRSISSRHKFEGWFSLQAGPDSNEIEITIRFPKANNIDELGSILQNISWRNHLYKKYLAKRNWSSIELLDAETHMKHHSCGGIQAAIVKDLLKAVRQKLTKEKE